MVLKNYKTVFNPSHDKVKDIQHQGYDEKSAMKIMKQVM